VAVPRSEYVSGSAGLLDVLDRVQYPAVIKPIQSRIQTDAGWVATTVHYAYSDQELRQLYRDTPYLSSHPSLIQQRIVGPGIGVFLLFDRGRLITEFAHRRLREKPPAGGASVLRESAAVDSRLREYAQRLLGPIGWHGVAMMEYKEDARTGQPFLMEVNGRFWGSLQLAIDAGVDFPYLVYQLALGRTPKSAPAYQIGVKSRWLLGDVDHLLLRLCKSDRELCLPPSAPSRLQAVKDFLRFSQPDLHYEDADADDLRPFLYELGQNTKSLSASAARLLRRSVKRLAHSPDGAKSLPDVGSA
jgi:predicted ATP-grasp superfamily ATP-dependent carboligase